MANLFDLNAENVDKNELIEQVILPIIKLFDFDLYYFRSKQVMETKWKFASTYSVGSASTIEERMPVWYLMDEFGSRIQHGDDFNFRLVPFMYVPEGQTCARVYLHDFRNFMYLVSECCFMKQNCHF